MTLAVLEGAIRKWVLGSESGGWSYLTYFSKDILFASLLLFRSQPRPTEALEVFRKSLLVGGGFVVLGGALACCHDLNLVGAALTFRSTMVLPIIASSAVWRVSGLRLLPLAALIGVLTCANCGLAIAQNGLPADHVLNRYVVSETEVAALDSGVRATGSFSYITGLAVLSSVGVWAGVVLLTLGYGKIWEVGGTVTILAGIGCALAAVSRGPVLVAALLLICWACFALAGRVALVKVGGILSLIILAAFALGIATDARRLGTAVLERHTQSGDSVQERAFGQLSQAVSAACATPFGNGLGTEQVAANYATTGIIKFTTFEEQMPRLILETGVLGLVGFIIICSGAILAMQRAKRATEDGRMHAVLLVTQVLLGCLFYTNVIFNHTASAFVWLIFTAVMAAVEPARLPLVCEPEPRSRNRFRRARLAP